jgi:hypothetical protein
MKLNFLDRLKSGTWKLFLLALPVTSFPLLARLAGGTSVARFRGVSFGNCFSFLFTVIIPQPLVPRQALPLLLFMLKRLAFFGTGSVYPF